MVCWKHDSSGFLIQCDANRHVSYTKKSSKSNSNFSINRMQRSIFSNTVYENRTSLVRFGFPSEGGPIGEAKTGQLFFLRHRLFSPSSWYKNCSVLIQLLHTSRRKKLACQQGIHSAGFYYGLLAFPIS